MYYDHRNIEWAKELISQAEECLTRQRTAVEARSVEGFVSDAATSLLYQCEQLLDFQKSYLRMAEQRQGKSLKDLRQEMERAEILRRCCENDIS